MVDIVLPAGSYYLGDLSQLLTSGTYQTWKEERLVSSWCFATAMMSNGIYYDNVTTNSYEVSSNSLGLVAFPLAEIATDCTAVILHTFTTPVHFRATTEELTLTSNPDFHCYRKL